jgi:hypothetical protein
MLENKEGEFQNANEINFYDLNDPFINDEEVISDNSEDGINKLTLPFGNHTEDEVIRNLMRGKKIKLKKKTKKVSKDNKNKDEVMIVDDENKDLNNNIGLDNSGSNIYKKRKFQEFNNENLTTNDFGTTTHVIRNEELNMQFSTFGDEGVDQLIKETLIDNEFTNEYKDILVLIRKLHIHYKNFRDEEPKATNFLTKLSNLVNISSSDLKLILEFEGVKVKREGTFSNLSKMINKFVKTFTDNNIRDIKEKTVLDDNQDTRKELVALSLKIKNYIESVQTCM